MCDFETLVNPDYTYVWAWAAKNIENGQELTGSTIEQFMEFLSKKKTAYFHNLGFDGTFIIDWLFRSGFEYSDVPGHKKFSVLRASTTMYSIDIYWSYNNSKKFHRTRIYDSYKKLPFKVARIAKAWKLPMLKGEIDYNLHRDYGHVMTDEEVEYILNDVRIVAAALKSLLAGGYTKMTIGSDAMSHFEQTLSRQQFLKFLPSLDLDTDAYIRKAYKGGFTYVNPKYAGKNIGYGKVYDVNSLYPSRMYYCKMPYGDPVYFDGRYRKNDIYDLYVCRVQAEFKVKKNHIPMIQIKKSMMFQDNEYIETSNGEMVELYLSSVDYQLFIDHYDIERIEHIDGYMFKSVMGVFTKYIDHWMEIKIVEKGAKKEEAKLFLNNLYGKLGTNPVKLGKVPYFDRDKDIVRYMDADEKITEPIYIPMAVFITAYARDLTIRACQDQYHRFIYADTDSLHLVGVEAPDIEVHDSKLGAWKHETDFYYARYLRPKTYIEGVSARVRLDMVVSSGYNDCRFVARRLERRRIATMLKVTCAGMQAAQHKHVKWDNFYKGAVYPGKLRPKTVPGGTVLVETTFQIS